jgi:hypothetical protein
MPPVDFFISDDDDEDVDVDGTEVEEGGYPSTEGERTS